MILAQQFYGARVQYLLVNTNTRTYWLYFFLINSSFLPGSKYRLVECTSVLQYNVEALSRARIFGPHFLCTTMYLREREKRNNRRQRRRRRRRRISIYGAKKRKKGSIDPVYSTCSDGIEGWIYIKKPLTQYIVGKSGQELVWMSDMADMLQYSICVAGPVIPENKKSQ